MNNITISNSNVGVLNTGDLAKIDAAITILKGTDADAIGVLIRDLSQAIIVATEMQSMQKKELLDLLQAVSDQVIRERKPSVLKSLLKSLEECAQGAASIIQIIEALKASVDSLLG